MYDSLFPYATLKKKTINRGKTKEKSKNLGIKNQKLEFKTWEKIKNLKKINGRVQAKERGRGRGRGRGGGIEVDLGK